MIDSSEDEVQEFISKLTVLSLVYGENYPEEIFQLITVPEKLHASITIYYRFICKTLVFLSKIKDREKKAIKNVFLEMLEKEKEEVSAETLQFELFLFNKYKNVIINTINSIIIARKKISNKTTNLKISKMLFDKCNIICSKHTSSNERINAIDELTLMLEENHTNINQHELRALMSLLMERLISKDDNYPGDIRKFRSHLASMLGKINNEYFSSNKGIWLRIKRYTNPEEKRIIKENLGYNPF